MDGADRTGRAEILALAAADTTVLDDTGDERRLAVALDLADHRDGPCRAMRRAGTAVDAIGIGDTEIVVHQCAADMDHGLLLLRDGKDGSGGTDPRAVGTLRTAEPAVEVHLGLHQVAGIGARTEYVVGAVGHAQLAGGAMLIEMPGALRSRRNEALRALRSLLGKDRGEAAVILLALLGVKQGGGASHQGAQHERALAGIRGLRGRLLRLSDGSFLRSDGRGLGGSHRPGHGSGDRLGGLAPVGEAVRQGVLRTLLDTVEAYHAARAVDLVGFTVDAGGLAVLVAFAAGDALALVDGHAEQREARNETQSRAYRADIVAP